MCFLYFVVITKIARKLFKRNESLETRLDGNYSLPDFRNLSTFIMSRILKINQNIQRRCAP
jgi:hypothetical protein